MTGESFQVGELVDVTIRRARVERHDGDGLALSVGGARIVIPVVLPSAAPSSVTTERVAPAEWPPQPGDLWADSRGVWWFVHRVQVGNARHETRLVPDRPVQAGGWWPDRLLSDRGPVTLVHRIAVDDEPDGFDR